MLTHPASGYTFIVAACCGVLGIAVTYFFVPNLQGEDLAIEDEKFRAYLVAHGWVGEMGEEDLKNTALDGVERGSSDGGERAQGVVAEKVG